MKVKIGNRVFQGEGVELARKVVNHRIPKNAKTFAIIGEYDDGAEIFQAAVDAEKLPFALNEVWDILHDMEESYYGIIVVDLPEDLSEEFPEIFEELEERILSKSKLN
jgi:hypothetical protein